MGVTAVIAGISAAVAAAGTAASINSSNKQRRQQAAIARQQKEASDQQLSRQNEQLAMDLTGLEYAFDDRGRYVLERKEDLKRRGLPSPDKADALALTFACDVIEDDSGIAMPVRQMRPYNPLDIGL